MEYLITSRYMDTSKLHKIPQLVFQMYEELKARGATHFRATSFCEEELVILEGWRVKPADEGPLPIPTGFI